jgi:hypothetical protein
MSSGKIFLRFNIIEVISLPIDKTYILEIFICKIIKVMWRCSCQLRDVRKNLGGRNGPNNVCTYE